jgi:hypothetical protein
MEADLELLGRWRDNDRQTGQELFARHFGSIYSFFEHKAGSEADELVQRTFLACAAARDQVRSQSSSRTYLVAIARNELYAYFREQRCSDQIDFAEISIAFPTNRTSSARFSFLLTSVTRADRITPLDCARARWSAKDPCRASCWNRAGRSAAGDRRGPAPRFPPSRAGSRGGCSRRTTRRRAPPGRCATGSTAVSTSTGLHGRLHTQTLRHQPVGVLPGPPAHTRRRPGWPSVRPWGRWRPSRSTCGSCRRRVRPPHAPRTKRHGSRC